MDASAAALILLSLAIGMSVGLSGIGGFLLVPAMIVIAGTAPSEAVATALLANLGAMVLTGGVSVLQRTVSRRLLRDLAIGSIGAALLAWQLVNVVPTAVARLLVAAFLAVMGARILAAHPAEKGEEAPTGRLRTLAVGALAQLAAVFAGIGGPAITVPGLVGHSQAPERVIGTALLHGALISGVGLAITLSATGPLDSAVLHVAAAMVLGACLAALVRTRVASLVSLRYVVGVLALVGSLATVLLG